MLKKYLSTLVMSILSQCQWHLVIFGHANKPEDRYKRGL